MSKNQNIPIRIQGYKGPIIHLTVTRNWFDAIAYGDKKEEYRDNKPYWQSRLAKFQSYKLNERVLALLKNGYGNVPSVLCSVGAITEGFGIEKWGAKPNKTVIIIQLTEVLAIYDPKKYARPKTRGQLLENLKNGIASEVVAINEEITNICLDGWLNFENQYQVRPSENPGWVVYQTNNQ